MTVRFPFARIICVFVFRLHIIAQGKLYPHQHERWIRFFVAKFNNTLLHSAEFRMAEIPYTLATLPLNINDFLLMHRQQATTPLGGAAMLISALLGSSFSAQSILFMLV